MEKIKYISLWKAEYDNFLSDPYQPEKLHKSIKWVIDSERLLLWYKINMLNTHSHDATTRERGGKLWEKTCRHLATTEGLYVIHNRLFFHFSLFNNDNSVTLSDVLI